MLPIRDVLGTYLGDQISLLPRFYSVFSFDLILPPAL
jgi:hypothetical protein